MNIKEKLKSNPGLKSFILRLLMPKNQARPRLWVKLFLNPFKHKKGKGARIQGRVRMDVLPFNNFSLGSNSTIEDFCTVNNGVGDVIIGERTRVGIGNVIIGPVQIGNDVIMAQYVVMSGLNHGYEDVSIPPKYQKVTTSPIVIEDEVWIGANVSIVSGARIGKHSVVAAGSVVVKDVPPYSIAGGNPARIIKQYNFNTKLWERIPK